VEDVASARRIHAIHHEAGGVVEAAVFPRKGAVAAESHGGDPHSVLALDGFEGEEGIGLASPRRGEFAGCDEVIDVGEDAVEAWVDGIDVDGDGNAVAAGDFRGMGDGRGIVAVDVEQAGT